MSEYTSYFDDDSDRDEREEDEEYDDKYYDICFECTGYGDDYYIDEDGDLVSACDTCPFGSLWHMSSD